MTNLQLELVKTFNFELSEIQLREIKALLSKYFAEHATDGMDRFADENNWNDETIEQLANEHLRVEYK